MTEAGGGPALPPAGPPQKPDEPRNFAPLAFGAGFIIALILAASCVRFLFTQGLIGCLWIAFLLGLVWWLMRRWGWRGFGQGLVAGVITGVAVVLLLAAACFAIFANWGR